MKRIPLIVATLFLVTNLFAQKENTGTSTKAKTTFGIKAGYNAAQIKIVNETSDFVRKESGFYAGAFVNIPTSDIFSVQPEIIYSSSGYDANNNISLLYLPISLRFELANDFTGFIGPEAQFLIGTDDVETQYFNDVMFGFHFGAAYKITENIFVEARPYFAITKLLDNGPGNYRRLNTFHFGLGYQF